MKAYLDNTVVSGAVKFDLAPQEQQALQQLLDLWERSSVDLCTSELTRREIEPYKGSKKADIDRRTSIG